MTIDANTRDCLLTEVERQQKYLDKLPDDFAFPLFNAARALESQRRSGAAAKATRPPRPARSSTTRWKPVQPASTCAWQSPSS